MMALKRIILEMGHGNDMHGGDYTKAALRAVQDCIHHSSLIFLRTLKIDVSALEIEEVFRTHPSVADCAVVGLPDEEWGQRVAMAWIVSEGSEAVDGVDLRRWGRERLAAAKVPVEYLLVDDLPRNALGKVTKPAVVDLFSVGDDV